MNNANHEAVSQKFSFRKRCWECDARATHIDPSVWTSRGQRPLCAKCAKKCPHAVEAERFYAERSAGIKKMLVGSPTYQKDV